MGLDISLHKISGTPLEEAARIEQDYEEKATANWKAVGSYLEATEEQREAVFAKNKALAAELGLNEDGSHPSRQDAEVPASAVDPDHMFKINYLRSSYNSGGINRVLRDAGVMDLYGIFGRTEDAPYDWRPDWQESLARADEAIAAWQAHVSAPGGNVRVLEICPNEFISRGTLPKSAAEALAIYRTEAAREHSSNFRSYGNSNGEFWIDGTTVRAIIPGTSHALFGDKRVPAAYVIADAGGQDGKEDWYLRALKITREMIAFVLAQPDADAYYLSWSA